MTCFTWRRAVLIALLPFATACGSSLRSQGRLVPVPSASVQPVAQAAPPQQAAAAPQRPATDPVLDLIAASDQSFRAGQHELEQGHFAAAKLEFNRAVDTILVSSYGGRTEPRLRAHFDQLIDRISAYEVKTLAQGDGFTEKKSDPASIDELLTLSDTFIPSRAGLQAAVQSDLQAGGHDINIPLNQRVLSYIELFQGRLHDFIEEGMKRGSKYLPMIQSVFRAEGLPLDLAYVPLVESAFKPTALSRTQAKGVWQFMAGTALENGLRRDWYIDERSDPEKATVAAAKYLGALGKMFDGDWHLALASYNMGPGGLQRALKQARASDFWQLAAKPRGLPRETREYVPMILAAIVIAHNPAQYGFDFETEAAPAYDKVLLSRPVDLRRVAEWSDSSIDVIQALNPELRRWTTPVGDAQYELKVPVGKADAVTAHLADAPETDLASLKWYTVKKGETLAIIAKKLQVSRTDLADANYLKAGARLDAGQKLMVPHEATVLLAARTERSVPVADARETVSGSGQLAQAANSNRVKTIYQVKQGDTLASIARVFRIDVAALRSWNKLTTALIVPGERLTIYARAD